MTIKNICGFTINEKPCSDLEKHNDLLKIMQLVLSEKYLIALKIFFKGALPKICTHSNILFDVMEYFREILQFCYY